MRKYFPYMSRPLVIYDFATAPFWISLYMRKVRFSFLSVQLAGRWGQRNWNSVEWGKKNFVLGREQPSVGKKSLVSAWRVQWTKPTREDPFHLYSLSPHLPELQQSAGATPLYSLCLQHRQFMTWPVSGHWSVWHTRTWRFSRTSATRPAFRSPLSGLSWLSFD